MKIQLLLLSSLVLLCPSLQAEIIAAWDFNETPSDSTFSRESWLASTGWGEAKHVNGSEFFLDVGAGGEESDWAWSLVSFPSLGTGTKTTGAAFAASTVGFGNVRISWREAHDSSSSRYVRFQYTTDGISFQDGPSIETPQANVFIEHSISLAGLAGVENNPLFGIRLVTEFERSLPRYSSVGPGPYHSSGAIRFDEVTLLGESTDPSLPLLQLPTLPPFDALENSPTTPISLGVDDPTAVLEARAVDEQLLPRSRISFSWQAPSWTLRMHPAEDRSGETQVAVIVRDGLGRRARRSFPLFVTATNRPPVLGAIASQTARKDKTLGPVVLSVADPEGKPLVLRASSSDPSLVPQHHFQFQHDGNQHRLIITPGLGQVGTSVVTVDAEDGRHRVQTQFALMVFPPGPILLFETFGYTPGSATIQSLGTWDSTGAGATIVQSQLRLEGAGTLERTLPGGPYSGANGEVIYTAFTLTCMARPLEGQRVFCFDHDADRACISLSASGTPAGYYRLSIINRPASAAVLPVDLRAGRPYRLVTSYDPRTGQTQLWVDPATGGTASVSVTNVSLAGPIGRAVLCGTAGGSALKVDDFCVTLAKESALELPPVNLSVIAIGQAVEVSWPDTPGSYVLQYQEANNWKTHDGFPPLSDGRRVVRFFDSTGHRFFRLKRQ